MASDGKRLWLESTAKMDEMVNSIQQIADIVKVWMRARQDELIVKTILNH